MESVSWHEAVEFCHRLSKLTERDYRLPSEAEWEYACRAVRKPLNLEQGESYPPFHFGDTLTDQLANCRASETYANEPKGKDRGKTTPVGQFPPNAFGLYDMHDNVWEWCLDPWHGSYKKAPSDGGVWDENNQQEDYYQDIVKNIEQLLTDDQRRVLRGRYYNDYPRYCRSAYRGLSNPRYDHLHNSLRVVCGLPRTS